MTEGTTYGPDEVKGRTVIEEFLEEVRFLNLDTLEPSMNMHPFMYAAMDASCDYLDLVDYLVRKDPSVLIGLHFLLGLEVF